MICSSAHAQIFVEQGKVEHLVHPGDRIAQSVFIDNTTNKDVAVKIYWEDFSYQAPYDGSKKFSPAGTLKSSLANWVKFSPRNTVIPPYGKSEIAYTINVPANASGGYYGVLFVEPQTNMLAGGDKGVRIITRVGSLFFVETGDRNKKADLQQATFQNAQFKAEMVNTGNVVLLPELSYYILDREGLAVDRGQLKKNYVPPGAVVPVELALGRDLKAGDYTLVLTFDLQDGDVLVKEIEFSKSSDVEYRLRAIRD